MQKISFSIAVIFLSAGLILIACNSTQKKSASTTQYVNTICVANSAGFDLYFDVHDKTNGNHTKTSSSYPIDQTKCMCLAASDSCWIIDDLAAGDELKPKVFADGGTDEYGNTAVYFSPNGGTATYTVTGTTLDFSVKLND